MVIFSCVTSAAALGDGTRAIDYFWRTAAIMEARDRKDKREYAALMISIGDILTMRTDSSRAL